MQFSKNVIIPQYLSFICVFVNLFSQRVQKKDVPSEKTHLLSLQFSWKQSTKPVGSSFIGTSPEFELALYTVVFFAGQNGKNCIEIADYDVEIVVHKMGDKKLGSSYPVALSDQQQKVVCVLLMPEIRILSTACMPFCSNHLTP